MAKRNSPEFGKIIKRHRLMKPMTLRELSVLSGFSASYLGRVERGERFPSAKVLQKIARPLGLTEEELLFSAGYLSPSGDIDKEETGHNRLQIDPYVVRMLSQEPVEVQRAVVGLVTILKSLAKLLKV